MGFFRRKKYPLPKFPEHIAPAFKGLCVPCSDDEIAELRMKLFDFMGDVESEAEREGMVSLDLAREIAQRLSYMLDLYPELDEKKRGYVVGAVRYFLSDSDGLDDFAFASGLNDDAQIVNHCLEEIGVEDMYIDIDRF